MEQTLQTFDLPVSLVSVQDAYNDMLPGWMFVIPCHQLTGKKRGLCLMSSLFEVLAKNEVPEGLAAIPIPLLFFFLSYCHDHDDCA